MRTFKNITTYALALSGLTMLFAGNVQAFPAFSTKEKKPCLYCHVSPNGGGRRNVAGTWYKTHGLSFTGYTPASAKPAAKPVVKKPTKPAAKKPAPKPPAKKKG